MTKPVALILHHNFPGQFKYHLKILVESGFRCIFICDTCFYKPPKGVTVLTTSSFKGSSGEMKTGAVARRFASEFNKLALKNIQPEITLIHSGWGIGPSLRFFFPDTHIIAYAEWWFSPSLLQYYQKISKNYKSELPDLISQYSQNSTIALELSQADTIICPTKWQASQFPKIFQPKLHVIHDGIDTSFFRPNFKWQPKNVFHITYTTRGLEPMRCYPAFAASIPNIIDKIPSARVTIVGEDKVCYSIGNSISHKEESLKNLQPYVDSKQVIIKDRLPLVEYARVLKSSHLHVYLSEPYITSWSLLEAMSSGCCILSNDHPMIKEFLTDYTFLSPTTATEDISASILNVYEIFVKRHKFYLDSRTKLRQRSMSYDYNNTNKTFADIVLKVL